MTANNVLYDMRVNRKGYYVATIEINNPISPYNGEYYDVETGINSKEVNIYEACKLVEQMFNL